MIRLFKANLFILLVLFCSCNGPSKKISPELKDKLVISFEAIVQLDDEFKLYYRKKGEKYKESESSKFSLKGSDEYQRIEFVLDQLVFPQNIRLVLGSNREQKEIQIKNIQFQYNNQKHVLTKQEIKKYFVANGSLEANFEELRFIPLGTKKEYRPFLDSYDISYFVNKLILF